MRLIRSIVIVSAVAAIVVAGPSGYARAGVSGYRHGKHWTHPTRAGPWCHREQQCTIWGCHWVRLCSAVFPSPYYHEWEVRDHWAPEDLARFDDVWCVTFGHRGSPGYVQCRANLYYDRLSLPLRVTH